MTALFSISSSASSSAASPSKQTFKGHIATFLVALLVSVFPAQSSLAAGSIPLDPPVSNGIADISVLEDAASTTINLRDVFDDDIDPDDALTFSVQQNTNPALVGLAIDNVTGVLTVSYLPDENGSASVTIRATDTDSEFTDESFQVTVTAVNDAPSFTAGTPPTINEDAGLQTINSFATSISSGPANESTQTLTFSVSGNTNPGLFQTAPSVSTNGTLTYSPAADVSGSSSITLVLTDNGGSANGGQNQSMAHTFTITVNSVNDAPSFTRGSNINVSEDSGPFTQNNWATNITAGPNESSQTVAFDLSLTNSNLFSAQPTVSSTGTLTFTPAPNSTGTSTITLSLTDNGGTANGGQNESPSQSFTITIDGQNDPPTTSGISNINVLEDANQQVINLFSVFDDEEDSDASLTYQELSNSNPSIFSSHNINPIAGTYTLVFAPDANGSSNITLRVTDTQGAFVDESFTVSVTAVNDEPSFTAGPNLTVGEDSPPQTVPNWATNISAGPANESTQTLTFNLVVSNPGLFQSGPSISSNGTLTYHPVANSSGTSSITVTLQDNGGTANGGDNQSPSQTFTITVSDQNDAPTSSPIADVQVLEDAAPQSIALFNHFDDVEDADNQLSYVVITNSNPDIVSIPAINSANGLLNLNYIANQHGTSIITVLATDSGGLSAQETFQLEILSVNDAPFFSSGGNVTVQEDSGPFSTGWATNISPGPAGEANQSVSFSISVDDPSLFEVAPTLSAKGLLAFTPLTNASGSTIATVTLQDDGGTVNGGIDTSDEITFTITISGENDIPVAVDDEYTVIESSTLAATPGGTPPGVIDNDIDLDGDVLTASIVLQPKHATSVVLLPNGSLIYTHNGDEISQDSLKYVISDGTATSNIATVYLNIKETNDPPVANNISDIIDAEDAGLSLVDLHAAFDDPDDLDATLTYTVSNTTNPALFSDLIINAETGNLELIYAENANGSSTVTVRGADPGGLSAETSFKVTLTPVNDPPTMTPGPNITLDEDPGPQSIANWATEIVAGPPDESSQNISISINNSNPGLFSVQPQLNRSGTNGTLTFTPAPQTSGQATVTITLTDNAGNDNTSSYDFLITIQGDNDSPTSLSIADIEVNEDAESISYNLFEYFSDIEDPDEDLIYTVEGEYDENLISLSISETDPRTLTVDFVANAFGETSFSIKATDTGGLFAQEDVDVRLAAVNDAPSFTAGTDIILPQNADPYAEIWATNISVGPANESTQEGSFTVSVTNGKEDLFTVLPSISSDGTLSFTPAIGDQIFGDAEISVLFSDDGGTENGGVSQGEQVTFNISIRRLNTPPTGNTDNYIVDQGRTLQVSPLIGVLSNDTDPENDDLAARIVDPPVHASSFTLNPDGSFTYVHNNTNTNSDAFTYVANDGFDDSNVTTAIISIQPSGTLSLTDIEVDEDAPNSVVNVRTALSLPLNTYEFTITDISDPTLFESTELDTLSGILTIEYAANQNGEANINIAATPAEGDAIQAAQKVIIRPVNDAPIAVDDVAATIQNRAIEIDVISNDVDFDDDNLTILRFSNPTRGQVQALPTGVLRYTPETDYTGEASFTYAIRDEMQETAEGEVKITIFSGRFAVSAVEPVGTPVSTSAAYNISDAGEVVGASVHAGGNVFAFTSAQSFDTDVPSEALDANDFGQIVGTRSFAEPGVSPVFLATLWDTSGVNNLGSFDGRHSKAYSINNEAQIVGVSTKTNSDMLHAALWNDGAIRAMESGESLESQAFDINEQGQTAGYVGDEAVIWRIDEIQDRLAGAKGRAYTLNGQGQAAGSIDDGTVKAVFWNNNNTSTSLHVAGSSFSEAYGINNTTWVVGAYLPTTPGKMSANVAASAQSRLASRLKTELLLQSAPASASKSGNESSSVNNNLRAFLWQGDSILDLNDFIDGNSGWVLLEARAINNAAQITGIGLFNGQRQAFLLSPTLNKAPTAQTDHIQLTGFIPTQVDVLANDIDEDGDPLQIVSVTQGSYGTVSVNADQTLTYMPGDLFVGSDTFTYVVQDLEGNTAEGIVELTLDASDLPTTYSLDQNYPNPFNPQTTIQYGLPEKTRVTLEVFNLLGQRIATLVDEEKPAGQHSVTFDAQNLPGGVYVYRLKTSQFEDSRQLVLLK